jgi:hypothetical protein
VANFATITAGVVDTGGKFATSVNDTGGYNTLPPVSTISAENLPLVSTIPAANNGNNISDCCKAVSEPTNR